ncbi:hypothetical protein ACFY2K_26195 [Kitasatospora sp. NPDC001309]|uniref:hypothetical protein n=1 Tax=Kitasatospora sp. NPDC001309 TaxID=3364013 RepID=UPI003678BB74
MEEWNFFLGGDYEQSWKALLISPTGELHSREVEDGCEWLNGVARNMTTWKASGVKGWLPSGEYQEPVSVCHSCSLHVNAAVGQFFDEYGPQKWLDELGEVKLKSSKEDEGEEQFTEPPYGHVSTKSDMEAGVGVTLITSPDRSKVHVKENEDGCTSVRTAAKRGFKNWPVLTAEEAEDMSACGNCESLVNAEIDGTNPNPDEKADNVSDKNETLEDQETPETPEEDQDDQEQDDDELSPEDKAVSAYNLPGDPHDALDNWTKMLRAVEKGDNEKAIDFWEERVDGLKKILGLA